MSLEFTLIIYFMVGMIQDLLITWHAISIIEKRPVLSGVLAAVNTVYAATIWHYLIPAEALYFWVNGIAYAVGGGLGVGFTIWYKKRKPHVSHEKEGG